MITLTNDIPIKDATKVPKGADIQQIRIPSWKERRREGLRAWRAANRERLQEYNHRWKAEHPDRVRVHRQREYSRRRAKRRRLRLRREAQRRRRELKRLLLKRIFPNPNSYTRSGNDSV